MDEVEVVRGRVLKSLCSHSVGVYIGFAHKAPRGDLPKTVCRCCQTLIIAEDSQTDGPNLIRSLSMASSAVYDFSPLCKVLQGTSSHPPPGLHLMNLLCGK